MKTTEKQTKEQAEKLSQPPLKTMAKSQETSTAESSTQAAEPPSMTEEKTTESQPDPTNMVARDEVNRLVAEAEARGYLRGRNETAAESMHTPQLWENPRRTVMEQECEPDPASGFLSKLRPGVWD